MDTHQSFRVSNQYIYVVYNMQFVIPNSQIELLVSKLKNMQNLNSNYHAYSGDLLKFLLIPPSNYYYNIILFVCVYI